MKTVIKHVLSLSLCVSLLLGSGAAADSAKTAPSETNKGTVTNFDYIMQFVDWYSLGAEGQDVLRAYFNQYFKLHPEAFVPIINDIMQSIDSHSMYMSAAEYAATFGQTLQNYIGIGITMRADGEGIIEAVNENGPAYEAGLRPGDVIVKVDGVSVKDLSNREITALLQGEEGSQVTITVQRAQQERSFTVERRAITPIHVSFSIPAHGVAYIRVTAMGSQEDADKFVQIWNALPAKDIRAAVIDLRGNGGGLVAMAQRMIETIVPEKGRKYLGLRYREDEGGLQEFYTPGGGPRLNKIVVLVDGGTASAAEIVSGSLSDLGHAVLLGEKTYGKGVGQYHLTMPDGSMLILTALEIQLPVRGTYEGEGLQPEIPVSKDAAAPSALKPLDITRPLLPGDRGSAVAAMTQRLSLLGLLDGQRQGFDAAVLDAVRRFQLSCGQFPGFIATTDTLKQLDRQAGQGSAGTDSQLAAALDLCIEAAQEPARYALKADGTWTNLDG